MQALRDVSFEVHEGEILGVAGVEGNGQSELVEVLAARARPPAARWCSATATSRTWRRATRTRASPHPRGPTRRRPRAQLLGGR